MIFAVIGFTNSFDSVWHLTLFHKFSFFLPTSVYYLVDSIFPFCQACIVVFETGKVASFESCCCFSPSVSCSFYANHLATWSSSVHGAAKTTFKETRMLVPTLVSFYPKQI